MTTVTNLAVALQGPLMRVVDSMETFSGVVAMTVETVRHIVVDLARGEFAWKEFFAGPGSSAA